jgi:hypothetical protein
MLKIFKDFQEPSQNFPEASKKSPSPSNFSRFSASLVTPPCLGCLGTLLDASGYFQQNFSQKAQNVVKNLFFLL